MQQPSLQPIGFFVGVDTDGDGSYADPNASVFAGVRFFTAANAVTTPDLVSEGGRNREDLVVADLL